MMSRSSSLTSVSELFRPRGKGIRARDLSSTRLSALKKEIKTDTHIISLDELAVVLETDLVNGLTSVHAASLLAYYGPNALTPSSSYTWQKALFKSMCTGFSVLVWAGAALCLIAYIIEACTKDQPSKDNLYLGCILIMVDVTCGLFSFTQNYKSVKIMKSFTDMIPQYAQCIRDGKLNSETLVRNLVRGDLVRVGAGDIVPADIRIIESRGFKVDNSSLTGESIAVSRSNCEGSQNILESLNVAFFSTLCVEGWAVGVVLCCGDGTAMGRVAGLAARLEPGPSPLAQQISRFMRAMSIWAIFLGVLIGLSSLILGYSFIQTIIFVIGIVVANVPEGLQPTVTAALTLTAKKMVTKNCLVKNIEAVEALGACNIICSDKTGTLTVNKMRLENVWVYNKIYVVDLESGIDGELQKSSVFETIKLCGSLCSSATINSEGIVKGDASESAILNFLAKYDRPMEHRKAYPKVAEIPFNSTNKYQVSVHLDSKSSTHVLMMKGAPECIITKCGNIATEKGNISFSKDIHKVIEKATAHMAETGKRILGFAYQVLDKSKFPPGFAFDSETINFPMENFTFIGVVGLMDPPRPEVHEAIKRVRLAGVRVLMVTGDHPLTALAIATKVGIATSPQCHVLTGSELREMTNDLLDKLIMKHQEIVFARTSPTQKLQIVESCQRLGAVVAVTGDGVNDAPALKQADIGISMGITGSQVSKQTADIILIDDNFATIVVGIEEGRKIYDNLKKSVCYILISNVPEIMPIIFFILFAIPLPLGAMTILCIDLGTDMWPAVALSHEYAESDVMARPPRTGESLVSTKMLYLAYGHNGLIETAAGMYCYFIVMAQFGFLPNILFGIRNEWDNEAISDLKDSYGQEWTYSERKHLERACQASYFMAIVLMQVMNGMVCKTRYNSLFQVGMKNHMLNLGFVFELALAAFICYMPGVNDFFRTYPLKISWIFLATPFIILLLVFEEFRKYCIRKELFGRWFNKTTFY